MSDVVSQVSQRKREKGRWDKHFAPDRVYYEPRTAYVSDLRFAPRKPELLRKKQENRHTHTHKTRTLFVLYLWLTENDVVFRTFSDHTI